MYIKLFLLGQFYQVLLSKTSTLPRDKSEANKILEFNVLIPFFYGSHFWVRICKEQLTVNFRNYFNTRNTNICYNCNFYFFQIRDKEWFRQQKWKSNRTAFILNINVIIKCILFCLTSLYSCNLIKMPLFVRKYMCQSWEFIILNSKKSRWEQCFWFQQNILILSIQCNQNTFFK